MPESFADVLFPVRGIDHSAAFTSQRKQTTPVGHNVRAYDPTSNRARGGTRPGLSKYIAAQLADLDWVIQEMALMSGLNPPGGFVQTTSSGRVVTLVAVSQGNVYFANAGDDSWTAATNSTSPLATPPLNITGVIRSAVQNQKLYFADGVNWAYYQTSDNTVRTWTATAGDLPEDDDNNTPRLICTWRGRTVLAGLLLDPQDWFMSAVNDPHDWDYAPLSVTPTQAIAGNNAPQGLVGDVITSLVPYTDDVLVFGGDHSLWMLRGDPMAGGQIDLISDVIGMAWGIPWCKDPYGNIFFVSNRTGIYTLIPGQAPQRISQQIEQILGDVDTGENTIRLVWNDRFQGLHVFITPTATAAAATHLFYETRTGAWWTDSFDNNNHNPLCCVTFDGNRVDDRVALIGSWDGYVRAIDPTASTDDGRAIPSRVVVGPVLTGDLDEMMLKDMQSVLGAQSGEVTFKVFVGPTAEEALESDPVVTGTWGHGRNPTNHIRRTGHAVYVELSSTNKWAMESIRLRIAGQGKVRRRGY